MDLLIRASHTDHTVVSRLSAPVSAGLTPLRRPPISAIVAEAHVALAQPALCKTAVAAGTPFLIDPMTPLLQDRQDPNVSPWARLPYATAEKVSPEGLADVAAQDRLVEQVLDFQRAHGATSLIPPYLYSAKLGDAWSQINQSLLRRTARYLRAEGVQLSVVPVFALSLLEYAPARGWEFGLDRYLDALADIDVRYAALSWSTSSPGRESFDKLTHLLSATQHAASRVPVIGWRQGLYGPALLAAGASGYETGAGGGERCHYPDLLARRRPVKPKEQDEEGGGGGGAFVYLATFGRSLARKDAAALLDHPQMLGSLVCPDPAACCSDGASSMLAQWREHAVRDRARQVERIERMPSATWRLNDLANVAQRSFADARLANVVLEAAGRTTRLPEDTFRSLGKALELLRAQTSHAA